MVQIVKKKVRQGWVPQESWRDQHLPKIVQKTVLWVPMDQNSRNCIEKVRTPICLMKKEPKPTLEIAGRPTVGPRFIHRTYSVSHKNQFQLLECPNFVLMAPQNNQKKPKQSKHWFYGSDGPIWFPLLSLLKFIL